MKIAHVCNYAPNFSGMYGTVRDILLEEQRLGYDAKLIDDTGGILKADYGKDGVTPVSTQFGDEADIICWHHAMAEDWFNESHRNIVLFLHGTPEFNFFGELYEKEDRSLSLILGLSNSNIPKAYISMWKRHVPIWESLLKRQVNYVPAWTDVTKYPISNWKPQKRRIKIALIDFWRITREPFNIFMAIDYLRRKHRNMDIEVEAWGITEMPNKTWQAVIQHLVEDNVLILKGRSTNPIEEIYSQCDLVVSMSTEETRVIREAYSCGVPVVCGRDDLHFTKYCGDSINPEKFAETIHKCWVDVRKNTDKVREELRKYAEENFSVQTATKEIVKIFENVVKEHGSVNTPKYIGGRKMVATVNETANKIKDRMLEEKPVCYVRYGDGDLLLMSGEERESFHKNSPELQESLIKAFSHKEEGYLVSSVAGMTNEGRMRPGLFARHEWDDKIRDVVEKYRPDEVLDNAIALSYKSVFEVNWFVDFLIKCIHGKKVLFVGGENLCNSALLKNTLNVNTFVSLPMSDAFYALNDKFEEIKRLSQEHDILICAAGMATRVLAHRLWERKVRIDFIDIGSIADALAGIETRTWIRCIDLNDYQNNFASVFVPSKTDIIVLTHGQEEKTINCFESIRKNTSNYRVIWIDNGSSEESINKVKEYASKLVECDFIGLKENLGFAKGVNYGLRKSLFEKNADYIVLLNNDTIVSENWLKNMIASSIISRIGIIGPLTSENNPHSLDALRDIVNDLPKFDKESIDEKSILLHRQYGTKTLEVGSMLSFFCTLIQREVLEQIGLLDENIFAYGEDNDFFERAKRLNIKFGISLGSYIHHDHNSTSKTMGEDWIEKTKRESLKYLNTKWLRQ